ncbi:MAG: cytochrome C [Bacteroidetes bacterium]|nr:MAG: cytochrome C [Bacteroidota bacterium]
MISKKTIQRTGLILMGLVILLQFIPMSKNNGQVMIEQDISACVPVSEEVKQVLKTSCNDCHSNSTVYPWYSHIQPIGFWLNHHVNEGKDELNFNVFATYKKKRQLHKLDEIIEMLEAGEMPLSSYTLIHKNATLNAQQVMLLINWSKASKQYLQRDTLALVQ